ncbi:MAG TPA: rhomboid family intramembrane serine protease [Candidatus Limnocylindrales bacterium]|nr:rhomboid family intramembrane serine protease [Candidatus Limnocylindrales bacterium]
MIPLRDANPTRRTPIVTRLVIVLCVVAFAWELGIQSNSGDTALNAFIVRYGVVPAELSAALARFDLVSEPVLDVVTSMFLHGGWLHLLGNLLYLWIFGNNVEDRLGHPAFVAFYLVGGFAAALAQVAIDPESTVPMIGASGAISATLGAYLVFFPGARVLSLVFLGFFYQLIPVPAIVVLGLWFVLQLVDGLGSLGVGGATGGVAFFAHIGGFVAGAVIALIVGRGGRRQPRSAWAR